MDELELEFILLMGDAVLNLISIIPGSHLWTLLCWPLNLNILTAIMLIKYQVLDRAPGIGVRY